MDPKFRSLLSNGLDTISFNLDVDRSERLLQYLELFVKWNSTYNLSAIRDPQEMLYKHLLDSLSVAPLLEESSAATILDVGTGGGLPGIPLAICFPEKHFTLLDSAGKKTRFLLQTVHTLDLKNVNVENKRVEEFNREQGFDVIVSRAFASASDMVTWCKHLLASTGEFWAMKGVFPEDELSELEKNYKVESCLPLQVPGDIGERCLVVIKPVNTIT